MISRQPNGTEFLGFNWMLDRYDVGEHALNQLHLPPNVNLSEQRMHNVEKAILALSDNL